MRNVSQDFSKNDAQFPLLSSHEDLDLVFVVDTTESMSRIYAALHTALVDIILKVRKISERPRVGVVCYKDHGDTNTTYLTKTHPLTTNRLSIVDFLSQPQIAAGQGGGGGAEAMECAFHVANELNWRPHAHKALVVLSDSPPHGGGLDAFSCCPDHNDYRDEVDAFRRRGVHLYPVLFGESFEAERVFEWMAAETRGVSIRMKNPADLRSLFMGVAHRETGKLGRYRKSLRSSGRLTKRNEEILTALSA